MTLEDLAAQMQRLEAAWGYPKDRTGGQMVAMTREWFTQLDRFGVFTVEAAFTHVIGANKWEWKGAIAEILAFCMKDDSDWRDALGLRDEPSHTAEPVTFEREGRTTAEEIEFRAREISEMKKMHGLKSHAQVMAEEIQTSAAPASKNQTVSSSLLQSCAARRARKLPTCEDSCAKTQCHFRGEGSVS